MGKKRKYIDDLDELIEEICADEELNGKVYSVPGIFFVFDDDQILEISDDDGNSARGGNFPGIFTGNSAEVNEAVNKIADKFGIDDEFLVDDNGDPCCDFDEDSLLDFFADDEEKVRSLKKLFKYLSKEDSGFASVSDFFEKFQRRELDEGRLYYMWDGEYGDGPMAIDLYDNIIDTGEERGEYDDLEDEDWLDILNNIEDYVVTAD